MRPNRVARPAVARPLRGGWRRRPLATNQLGFHVTGIDNRPQPRYAGDAFVQADALEYVAEHGSEYDARSTPRRLARATVSARKLQGNVYPMLIELSAGTATGNGQALRD